MTLFRMPGEDELRAVCWNHATCCVPELCACTCHVFMAAVDVVDR